MTLALALDESQKLAVDLACTEHVGIVTGEPGTGKSTCLKFALDRLDRRGQRYELCSPTGKAAKRLHETTGRQARTIHRLLEYHPRLGWQRNRDNPIDTDAVIVDESSMIDTELGAALLSGIDASRTRLVLIGDANQLPPVGPGRLFGDMIDHRTVPVARLQTLHRSAQESWVATNAPLMLQGRTPSLEPRPDFRFLEVAEAAQLLPTVRRLVTEVVPNEIDADAQVLIPQRPGVAGIDAANRILQDATNPRRPGDPYVPRESYELRLGDRVIQTRNDYLLGVFNGETGVVVDIASDYVMVEFDAPVKYSLDQARALQLAYALTVHRAQGSEYPWVICVVHSTHSQMLTRSLVYTAVTRAKQGVILVGDRKGLRTALSGSHQLPKRNTTLSERIDGRLEPAQEPE